jgi:hypothetical protein
MAERIGVSVSMDIVDSRTLRTSELSPASLLETCRESTEPPEPPVPVWVRSGAERVQPIWMPPGWDDGETVEALVLGETSRSDWSLTLSFWNRYGGLNPVEKGKVLRELSPEGSDRARLLDQLDLPGAQEVIRAHRELPDLPEPLRAQVASGDVSPRLFRYFFRIPDNLRPDLMDMLNRDHRIFSVQDTRQLAEALRRLSPEKYESFLSAIEPPEEDVHAREIGQTVLEEARKRAYPELNQRRNEFERDLEALDLDGRIDVEHPSNFEGKYLEFSFRCERDEDLEPLAEEVKKCRTLLEHV